MLGNLRSHVSNFTVKLLLAFLVLSFAIWGVGDMISQPRGRSTVATVGSKAISLHEYEKALRQESDRFQKMLGDRYSPELAKSLDLPQRVLRQLVDEALIKLESESLGIVPSDADVVKRIRSNPSFHDTKGNFDKAIFEATLRQGNLSEKAYVEQLRRDIASTILMSTLVSAIPVPEIASKMLMAARNEQRSATFYAVGPSMVGELPQPDDAALQAYYNQYQDSFTVPEYRIIHYISFKNDAIPVKAAISEQQLHDLYKDRIDEFKQPERRVVDQLLYGSEADAKKAYGKLQSGTEFSQLVKNSGIINKTSVSLGAIERGNMLEAAEEEVFSMQAGEFTAPIQSPFGWHIFRVGSIEGPSTLPFEKVRSALEKDLKQHAAENAVNDFANTLEDALAGGSSLKDIAREFNFNLQTLGPVSKDGKAPNGAAVTLPSLDKFLDIAFRTEEQSESGLMTSKGGVYYLLQVDKIMPEHVRPLSEVKAQVIAGWKKEEMSRRLDALAHDITSKMAKKEDRGTVIAKFNLVGSNPGSFKRQATSIGDMPLPGMLVEEIFRLNPGDATGAYPVEHGNYLFAVVREVKTAPLPSSDDKALMDIRQSLSNTLQQEAMIEYMNHLEEKYPVSINENLLESVER